MAFDQALLDRYNVTPERIKETRQELRLDPQYKSQRFTDDDIINLLLMADRHYRLTHIYYVKDEDGNKVLFVLNEVQEYILNNLHYLNIFLKARQRGITTFICLLFLDLCLTNENISSGIVAQTEGYARAFFDKKVKFAYDNLPEGWLHPGFAESNRGDLMKFANGSSIYVDCSLRSDTVQYLHISEFGEVCATRPEKAREIVSGALNAIHAGNYVFIESTGAGSSGYFYDYCQDGLALALSHAKLNPLQWKFFFIGWYCGRGNRLPADSAVITKEDREYFATIQPEIKKLSDAGVIMPIPGGVLSEEQKAWYVEKKRQQKDNMLSQHPSTPDEAFKNTAEGVYFRKEIAEIRSGQRIRTVPYEKGYPVNTSWDFGKRGTAIWFHQYILGENRIIHYHENFGKGFEYYVQYMQKLGYFSWGTHYLPHDATTGRMDRQIKSYEGILIDLGLRNTLIVPRTQDKRSAREEASNFLLTCYFDQDDTAQGIICLENYRRKFDKILQQWLEDEYDDEFTHGADAFICLACGREIDRGGGSKGSNISKRKKPSSLAFR